MASENNAPALIAGLNKTKKLILAEQANGVYLATDADENVTKTVMTLCEEYGVSVDHTKNKTELSELCGIEVGCAVCVVTK